MWNSSLRDSSSHGTQVFKAQVLWEENQIKKHKSWTENNKDNKRKPNQKPRVGPKAAKRKTTNPSKLREREKSRSKNKPKLCWCSKPLRWRRRTRWSFGEEEELEEKILSDHIFVLGFVFGFVHEFLGLEVKSGMARTQIWRKKKRKEEQESFQVFD